MVENRCQDTNRIYVILYKYAQKSFAGESKPPRWQRLGRVGDAESLLEDSIGSRRIWALLSHKLTTDIRHAQSLTGCPARRRGRAHP